jgi:hypothetical protein
MAMAQQTVNLKIIALCKEGDGFCTTGPALQIEFVLLDFAALADVGHDGKGRQL